MKHLFIVNPIAGGRNSTDAVSEKVKAAFNNREDSYEIYVTKAPMDAARKIKAEAASGEHIRVYACGGDGTFNECVCGAALLDNIAVCPYPTGTGNDFCRMFGDEKDMFCDLNALINGTETAIDLINCNGRYSANICSVGIDARIGADVHKYSSLPIIGGATAYVVSTVVNLLKGTSTPMHITAEGYNVKEAMSLVCVCNGRFYGGGFNPSRTARPDDGRLDILAVKKASLFTFARLIGKYASGYADQLPKYIKMLEGNSVKISFDEENVINVDGEIIYAKEVEMHIVPKAMKLVVPQGMRFFG